MKQVVDHSLEEREKAEVLSSVGQPMVRKKMAQNGIFLSDDGILHITCVGDQDRASVSEMVEETLRILDHTSVPIKVLFDATKAGRFSVEARQGVARFLAQATRGKAAIVASSASMRALGLFMTGGANANGVRFFESRREALKWFSTNAGPEKRGIGFPNLWRALFRVRWLRIKERWLREVFEVLQSVAMGDFSRRIAASNNEDELALIEAGINLMADDLEDRDREAREYESRLREERNRIARELHDSVSQLLFSAVLNSEAASALVESDPELSKARIETARVSASEAQQQMRDLLTELRLSPLLGGLTSALNMLTTKFSKRERIETSFSVDGERQLAPSIERELFRIAQEALNNVAKHSRATSAVVELVFSSDLVRLSVEDNGVGFDPSHPKSGEPGLGLTHMQERAEGLGGKLAIESAPGKGAKIMVEMPLEESHG